MAKVLLLLTAPAWRGSGLSFAKIAVGLQQHGHYVQVIAANQTVVDGLKSRGVYSANVIGLPDSSRSSVALLKPLRHNGWDLVIADSPRDVRLASSANLGPIAWRFNLPNRPVPSDLWSRWLFRRVQIMVYQSEFAKTVATEQANWLRRIRSCIVPNGYDVANLSPDRTRGDAWRNQFGIPLDAPLLVTVAALSPEKALPQTLAVGAALLGQFPGLRQVIVGSGEMQGELQHTVRPHVLLTGELPAADALDALRAADVVLQLSAREMFPNVVAEAMAVGGVVVGSESGATPEVIGEAGVLVPLAIDPTVEVVGNLLRDQPRREALGLLARNRIADCFNLERMTIGYRGMAGDIVPGYQLPQR